MGRLQVIVAITFSSRATGLLSGLHIFSFRSHTGLLSHFYFIRVPLRKKVLKYGTPKPSITTFTQEAEIKARPPDRMEKGSEQDARVDNHGR